MMHRRHQTVSNTYPNEQTKIHQQHIPLVGYRPNYHWRKGVEMWVGRFSRPRDWFRGHFYSFFS
jgi:hypothetical protein